MSKQSRQAKAVAAQYGIDTRLTWEKVKKNFYQYRGIYLMLIPVLAWFAAIPFMGMSGMDVLYHVLSGVGYGAVLLALVLLFDKILGKESMGGGDLKLFVVMGLYLGVAASLFALFFSCILGLITGLVQKQGKEGNGPQIPFGPAIALAFYAMLLYGDGLCATALCQ